MILREFLELYSSWDNNKIKVNTVNENKWIVLARRKPGYIYNHMPELCLMQVVAFDIFDGELAVRVQ